MANGGRFGNRCPLCSCIVQQIRNDDWRLVRDRWNRCCGDSRPRGGCVTVRGIRNVHNRNPDAERVSSTDPPKTQTGPASSNKWSSCFSWPHPVSSRSLSARWRNNPQPTPRCTVHRHYSCWRHESLNRRRIVQSCRSRRLSSWPPY